MYVELLAYRLETVPNRHHDGITFINKDTGCNGIVVTCRRSSPYSTVQCTRSGSGSILGVNTGGIGDVRGHFGIFTDSSTGRYCS